MTDIEKSKLPLVTARAYDIYYARGLPPARTVAEAREAWRRVEAAEERRRIKEQIDRLTAALDDQAGGAR